MRERAGGRLGLRVQSASENKREKAVRERQECNETTSIMQEKFASSLKIDLASVEKEATWLIGYGNAFWRMSSDVANLQRGISCSCCLLPGDGDLDHRMSTNDSRLPPGE